MIRGRPNALDALAKAYPLIDAERVPDAEQAEERMARAMRDADVAKQEMEQGFPFLFSQAAAALWASLEDLVRTFLVAWITNRPQVLETDSISKLKVKLGDYLGRSDQEQYEYILDLLTEDIGATRRFGVERFESVLKPFGLSGHVREDVAKALFELQQLRHVIVHRQAVVDRRLLKNCPWLPLNVGQTVVITHERYNDFWVAAITYVIELIQRVREQLGISRISSDSMAPFSMRRLPADFERADSRPQPAGEPDEAAGL